MKYKPVSKYGPKDGESHIDRNYGTFGYGYGRKRWKDYKPKEQPDEPYTGKVRLVAKKNLTVQDS